jgi:DNA-binding FrmR family transcriptional regulator
LLDQTLNAMNPQQLQDRLEEIEGHLKSFKQRMTQSEHDYQNSLKLLTDPKLRSALMEEHVLHIEEQKQAIERMEKLYCAVQSQLLS